MDTRNARRFNSTVWLILSALIASACVPDKGCSRANYAENEGNFEWLLSREDSGDACVEQSLGRIYLAGRDGIPQDVNKGLNYLRAAAEKGLVTAEWELAVVLLDDHRWDSSKEEALRNLTEAARAGNLSAQTLLGQMLLFGERVPKDEEQGIYWLRKAAENGSETARRLLNEHKKGTD